MIRQDTIPVEVPKPEAPNVVEWIIANPRPSATVVLTILLVLAWRTPKLRGVMIFALGIFLGVWLFGEAL